MNQITALPSSPASSAARVITRAISSSLVCTVGAEGLQHRSPAAGKPDSCARPFIETAGVMARVAPPLGGEVGATAYIAPPCGERDQPRLATRNGTSPDCDCRLRAGERVAIYCAAHRERHTCLPASPVRAGQRTHQWRSDIRDRQVASTVACRWWMRCG